jgi:hypothetical protein
LDLEEIFSEFLAGPAISLREWRLARRILHQKRRAERNDEHKLAAFISQPNT